uniref:carbonyl reductase (NADPH) n=1 Tax=Danio rerio TaxID=7955 RepID=Q9DF44_DANRE|nr:carbonyl reductase 1-like [Danio rerio]AAG23178.1 20 beta-hydroxysteroid dehydrogenase [Danio rerio]|eukprot:NP_919360.1 carbonyl reductase [NADPH] 1 [Danio rerio]
MSKKVAVVTGANKGIGLAIVKGLCKAGFTGDILLTARNEKLGQEAIAGLQSEGFKNVVFHQLDICDQGSCMKLKKFLEEKYGGLDVLINNAGIAFKNAATEPFGEQAEVTMRTNFWGTLWACHALLPILRANARVVNVSSFVSKKSLDQCSAELQAKFRNKDLSEEELCLLMGEFVQDAQAGDHSAKGWPNTAYGTTKIGVTVLSRIQARVLNETRPGDGILLNACCPGWVRTDMAGPKAPKSPEEGAETPVYLAMLPEGAKEPHGQLVWDKTVQEW